MKTKININGKEVEIELTSEQVEVITKASKNEFELDYKDKGGFLGTWEAVGANYLKDSDYIKHGRYRKNKELAELSLKHNQQFNRLEELVMWLEPDWRADWHDFKKEKKAYIVFEYETGKFYVSSFLYTRVLGAVYMSIETANKICDALNNGELPELAEILKG